MNDMDENPGLWERHPSFQIIFNWIIGLAVIAAAIGSLAFWDWLTGGAHAQCSGAAYGYEQCQDDNSGDYYDAVYGDQQP